MMVNLDSPNIGRGTATVRLRHVLEAECGSHVLRLSCTLWVYNCSGLPIALQQSDYDDLASALEEVRTRGCAASIPQVSCGILR